MRYEDPICDKLRIVFLSELVGSANNTLNQQIAEYIIVHIDEIRTCTIGELAIKCHVANSSISRFCKDIGLNSFSELRDLLRSATFRYQVYSKPQTTKTCRENFVERAIDSLHLVATSLDYGALDRLARDIDRYSRIGIFGLLKAETVAMNLQSDLLALGKMAYTSVLFRRQLDYIRSAKRDDLIIIFSYTGIYFDYTFPRKLPEQLEKPKIYFITGNERIPKNEYFDEVIRFRSLQDDASHPFQLQLVGSLIARNYADYLEARNQPIL